MDLSTLERSIKSLEASLDSFETLLAWMTALVVIGLVIEYWHEIPEAIEEVREARKLLWKPACVILGAILITVGVAGELAVQFLASRKQGDLRSANRQIEGVLTAQAETARQKANEADERAINLQTVLLPRRVSPFALPPNRDEKYRAVRKLQEDFAGTSFLLQSVPFFEAEMLTNDLEYLLTGLKWKGRIIDNWHETGMRPVLIHDGVEIWTWRPKQKPPVVSSRVPRDRAWLAAEALARVLTLNEIQLVAHFDVSSMKEERFAPFGFNPPENAVVVFIGMKNIGHDVEMLR
jgi:hypothetical protein